MGRFLMILVVFAVGAGAGIGGDRLLREPEKPLAQVAARQPAACPAPAAHSDSAHAVAVIDSSEAAAAAVPATPAVAAGPGADSAAAAGMPGDTSVAGLLQAAGPVQRLSRDRLAKVFRTMQPRDAAKVLEKLDDAEVGAMLGLLPDRQVAGVLTNLPADRAAALSRTAMRTGRSLP